MRTGDLNELTGAMAAANPFVPAGCLDATTKRINPACIDPVAGRLVGLYPLPNVPGEGFFTNNFISNGVLNNDVNQFDLRVDHTLSGNDNIFGRYSFQQTDRIEPPLLNDPVASGDFASNILIRGQNFVTGWSRVFGSQVLRLRAPSAAAVRCGGGVSDYRKPARLGEDATAINTKIEMCVGDRATGGWSFP